MRFNDRELASLCDGQATVEGRLHHKKIGGNRSHSGFKERWFKLRYNILFYYNLSETGNVIDKMPSGAIVLENCSAVHEEMAETPFTFSVIFKDEVDRKHVFSGRTESSIQKWITLLNSASYENLRLNLNLLQNRLTLLTGRDPLLMFYRSECSKVPLPSPESVSNGKEKTKLQKKSTFRSYVDKNAPPVADTDNITFIENYFGNSLNAIGGTMPEEIKPNISSQATARPRPLRKAPDPPSRPPRGQKVPSTNLIEF